MGWSHIISLCLVNVFHWYLSVHTHTHIERERESKMHCKGAAWTRLFYMGLASAEGQKARVF